MAITPVISMSSRRAILLIAAIATVNRMNVAMAGVCEYDGDDGGLGDLAASYGPHVAGDLAFTLYTETEGSNLHLSCYEKATEEGAFSNKVTIEFKQGFIGVASKAVEYDLRELAKRRRRQLRRLEDPVVMAPVPGDDGDKEHNDGGGGDDENPYPFDGQDSWGQIDLQLKSVNGNIPGLTGQSITASDPACTYGDGSQGFYDEGVVVTQVISPEATVKAYMFKNDDIRVDSDLENTMTIDTMGKCKLELLYGVKPNSGGGLELEVKAEVKAGFSGDEIEREINEGIQLELRSESVVVQGPERLLRKAVGLDYEDIDATTMTDLFECSKVFVCDATNAHVTATFVLNGNEMKATLSSSDAPESCGTMWWDPLVTPLPGGAVPGRTDHTVVIIVCVVVVLLLVIALVVVLKVKKLACFAVAANKGKVVAGSGAYSATATVVAVDAASSTPTTPSTPVAAAAAAAGNTG